MVEIFLGRCPTISSPALQTVTTYRSLGLPGPFLNQARAGHRPAHAWFLKIDPVRTSVCVFVCVCVRPRGY